MFKEVIVWCVINDGFLDGFVNLVWKIRVLNRWGSVMLLKYVLWYNIKVVMSF